MVDLRPRLIITGLLQRPRKTIPRSSSSLALSPKEAGYETPGHILGFNSPPHSGRRRLRDGQPAYDRSRDCAPGCCHDLAWVHGLCPPNRPKRIAAGFEEGYTCADVHGWS